MPEVFLVISLPVFSWFIITSAFTMLIMMEELVALGTLYPVVIQIL